MALTNLWDHPKVGEHVRFIGASDGTRTMGVGNPLRWLRGGAFGIVVRVIEGYPEHHCPDHDGGRIPPQMDAPVIAWDTWEGDPIERCINPEDENTRWERITP